MLRVDFEKRLGDFRLRPRFEAGDELVVLLGPSGSGKSQTLRAIAGLLRPDRGRIELPDAVVYDSEARIDLRPQERSVGYVVQDLALFPHLSVAENIAFGLNRWPREEQHRRVEELVGLLGLGGLETRLPGQISGGQQQRVAIGRALAARPRVLLFDEPFSALDAPIRNALRREVSRLQRQLGLLTLFVTHDLQEAYSLADLIVVYSEGAVLQFGERDAVFRRPASVQVAQLLDARNIFAGRVVAKNEAFTEIETPWFRGRARAEGSLAPGAPAALSIRPEHVLVLRRDRPHSDEIDTLLDVELVDEVATGNNHRLYLQVVTESPAQPPCIIEADISAHPYEVMGIASHREWRVALPVSHTVALAVDAPA